VMNIARIGNRYLQETEPWKVAKTDPERVKTILNVALQLCANIAVAFEPFLPFMSEKLRNMLALGEISWSMLGSDDIVAAGSQLNQPELLFEKIEDDVIQAQLDRLAAIKEQNRLKAWQPEPQAAPVDFDTFLKVDIRVGKVLECQAVPKADKLLRFLIDDGMGTRTIVSGIAKYYKPEDLVGKQICFIANFPPRKLKGVESQGMILSAENPDGSLTVITPEGPLTPGSKIC
ncbi:MAG: methionine--tRNA ligase subunit beta, partial [Muribaculaceae bacterium]|nr:methionine--tRNA ligase subunit beta [Muribaculaceae bacterium]